MAGELTITVVGNLANDPEIRHVAGGIAVVNLTWLQLLVLTTEKPAPG